MPDTQHFEIWYTHPEDGVRRHQKADTVEDATTIAGEHTHAGMNDVQVHQVTTTHTPVEVTIPPKPDAEASQA
jgi:hypothetical protein